MFRRPSYRKRSLLAMGFAFIGQSTAVLVINNYGPTLYKALGYGTKDQLALQCGWITVGIIFNFVGAALMDRIGRRPLMLFGISGCCVALIIEAAMVATYAEAGTNKAGLGVGVAALYIFLAIYGVGIDVAGVVFYGELFPNHVRAKGLCLSTATIAITDLVYLQATATAFANIGWKFYLVSTPLGRKLVADMLVVGVYNHHRPWRNRHVLRSARNERNSPGGNGEDLWRH